MGKMNHPCSQSRSSKRRNLHPTTGRTAAFWGTEHSTCQIILSLLLLPEEIKNKHCQKVLQQSKILYLAYKTGSKEAKWRESRLRCSPWWQLCSSLPDADPQCWMFAQLPVQLMFCLWMWLRRESSSPSLLGVLLNCTLRLESVQISWY